MTRTEVTSRQTAVIPVRATMNATDRQRDYRLVCISATPDGKDALWYVTEVQTYDADGPYASAEVALHALHVALPDWQLFIKESGKYQNGKAAAK